MHFRQTLFRHCTKTFSVRSPIIQLCNKISTKGRREQPTPVMAQDEASSYEAKTCVWVRGVSAVNLLMPIDLVDSGSLDSVEYAGRLIAYHRIKHPSSPTAIRYACFIFVSVTSFIRILSKFSNFLLHPSR